MTSWLVFGILAIALIGCALMVVLGKNLVHSVIWLAAALISTAVLYVTLQADFLAAVQVLLYTGGVITLMLFGVMLTRRYTTPHIAHGTKESLRGAGTALAVMLVIGSAIWRSMPFEGLPDPAVNLADTQGLGKLFLTDLMLPFEVLSVLLLAAMIGAIALSRRSDP